VPTGSVLTKRTERRAFDNEPEFSNLSVSLRTLAYYVLRETTRRGKSNVRPALVRHTHIPFNWGPAFFHDIVLAATLYGPYASSFITFCRFRAIFRYVINNTFLSPRPSFSTLRHTFSARLISVSITQPIPYRASSRGTRSPSPLYSCTRCLNHGTRSGLRVIYARAKSFLLGRLQPLVRTRSYRFPPKYFGSYYLYIRITFYIRAGVITYYHYFNEHYKYSV